MAKKKRRASSSRTNSKILSPNRKLIVIAVNLLLFAVLSIISFFLYNISTNIFYINLFFLLTVILGFVAIALFISLLVVVIARAIKR